MNPFDIEAHINCLENLPAKEKRPYYKYVLYKGKKYGLYKGKRAKAVLIFWSPGAYTRPHNHSGSEAKITVIKGCLIQKYFVIHEEFKKVQEREWGIRYHEGDDFIDDARGMYEIHMVDEKGKLKFIELPAVHQVLNESNSEWAVSFHVFEDRITEHSPLEAMWVHDFDREVPVKWKVRGDEDTWGDPPENAVPIWPGGRSMAETYPLKAMKLVENIARDALAQKRQRSEISIERKDPPYLRVYFSRDCFGIERNIHLWVLGYNQVASEVNACLDDDKKRIRKWTRRTLSIVPVEMTFSDHEGNLAFMPSSVQNVKRLIEEAYAEVCKIHKRDLDRQDKLR